MVHYCGICDSPIHEGDKVQFIGRATYHRLKSKIMYALDKSDMEAFAGSLAHVGCVVEPSPEEHDEHGPDYYFGDPT